MKKRMSPSGLTGTIIFHGLLLLLFILLGFKAPYPPPGEEGILINFGNSETGLGETQPQGLPDVQKTNPVSNNEEELLTQNIEEAAYIKDQNKKNTDKQKVTETTNQTDNKSNNNQQQVNQNALFPGNNNSQGEGITNGSGDQGSPEGDPNSDKYKGTGLGDKGTAWSLAGRSNKALPKPRYNDNEQGKVVVEIFVDRAGNVIKANTGYKGTTISSQNLRQAAYDAAVQAKFNVDPGAPEVQRGVITYVFELQ